MQTFSQVLISINEVKKDNPVNLTRRDVEDYVSKVKRHLPRPVLDVVQMTLVYELFDGDILKAILGASKNELQKLSSLTGVSTDKLEDLQKRLVSLKSDIRLLPQFQSDKERASLIAGDIRPSDLTVDLSTSAGRNAAAKMYTPLVYKIANQYVGKSSLDRAELISAGMMGLANAMNEFDAEKTDSPFKAFASQRILQQIQADMDEYSHSLSGTNWYAVKNYGDKLDAVSIDNLRGKDDDDDYSQDHLSVLSVSDDMRWLDLDKSEQEYWKSLFKIIDSKFSVRDCNIFYRYFGLGEFWGKKEKSKDIAKSYGMSEGNIRNSVINKMLTFLKNDPRTRGILMALQTIYNESLMKELIYITDRQSIYEALISDDMFILLEELNRWNNKNVYANTISNALDMIDNPRYIIDCLNKGFDFIDSTFKKNKTTIVSFLKVVYPTESFNRVSDVTLIEKLVELSDIAKQYKIEWKS